MKINCGLLGKGKYFPAWKEAGKFTGQKYGPSKAWAPTAFRPSSTSIWRKVQFLIPFSFPIYRSGITPMRHYMMLYASVYRATESASFPYRDKMTSDIFSFLPTPTSETSGSSLHDSGAHGICRLWFSVAFLVQQKWMYCVQWIPISS